MNMNILQSADIRGVININTTPNRTHEDISEVVPFIVKGPAIDSVECIGNDDIDDIVMLSTPLDGPGIGLDRLNFLLRIKNRDPFQAGSSPEADEWSGVFSPSPTIGQQGRSLVQLGCVLATPDAFQCHPVRDRQCPANDILAGRHLDDIAILTGLGKRFAESGCIVGLPISNCAKVSD
ncbi:MAG: hypothetical protein UZ16_OP3001001280 [Candidatus Hinthialibacteria bacterium OLB16]|nr:MAG: hypothetical protein UZ16_OP3001001280 [Candidatus Hinthialibacteria bacterium OLB16]